MGSGRVLEYLKALLDRFAPSQAHLLIPRFRWRGIATTNYDLLVEAAYDSEKNRLQTLVRFVKDSEPVLERLQLAKNPVPFLKLHGCLDHVHDVQIPPILTPEHYAHHADHRRRLFDRLNDWAHESPMIFCGYRLGDAHIRSLIDRLSPGTRPTFY
jgi:hypothetical protein